MVCVLVSISVASRNREITFSGVQPRRVSPCVHVRPYKESSCFWIRTAGDANDKVQDTKRAPTIKPPPSATITIGSVPAETHDRLFVGEFTFHARAIASSARSSALALLLRLRAARVVLDRPIIDGLLTPARLLHFALLLKRLTPLAREIPNREIVERRLVGSRSAERHGSPGSTKHGSLQPSAAYTAVDLHRRSSRRRSDVVVREPPGRP
jgi:hypothetical protein